MSEPASPSGSATGLFRQQAIDRLHSPEGVDRLMRVVGPVGWLLLLSLAFLLAIAVWWGFAGRIATSVSAQGILGPAFGERHEVVAPAAGILRAVSVRPGDIVTAGQVVARLEILSDSEMAQDASRTLAELQAERARQAAFWSNFVSAQTQNFATEKSNVEDQLKWTAEQIAGARSILASMQALQAKGLATDQQVQSAQDTLISALAAQDSAHARLQALQASTLDLGNQQRTALQALDDRILQAQEQLADARAHLQSEARITAGMNGVVVELDGQLGTAVVPGSAIMAIQSKRPDLEGVFFADPRRGKYVRVGMDVDVAPSTAEPARYGTIRGKVAWVSPAPLSENAVVRQLGNPTLATLLTDNLPPIAFGVTLERDPSTPTGFAWTSGRGPKTPVATGTLAGADVTIREDAPVRLVVPALRRLSGIEP